MNEALQRRSETIQVVDFSLVPDVIGCERRPIPSHADRKNVTRVSEREDVLVGFVVTDVNGGIASETAKGLRQGHAFVGSSVR